MDKLHSVGETIRVLIVDDHAFVRRGLRTFLELSNTLPPDDKPYPQIQVVGEAANGREAIRAAGRTQPDIVLFDFVMPGTDNLQVIPKLVKSCPRSRVMLLTSLAEQDDISPAIQAGAHGYLVKDISPNVLAQAVRDAYRGKLQTNPRAKKKHIASPADSAQSSRRDSRGLSLSQLTNRECEVVTLIAAGMSNRSIAQQMAISEKTVKTHVSNILNKLRLEDRTQLAVYAFQHGFVIAND